MASYQWKTFWADLEPTRGSEQAGNRPVLVVSSEAVNQALPIVTVLPLTTAREGRKIYPTEALLPGEKAGLPHDSIAMAHQIRTISKERIGTECGAVNDGELKTKVKNALRTYLDL